MGKSMNSHLNVKPSPASKAKVSHPKDEDFFETLVRNGAEQIGDAREQRLFRSLDLNNDQYVFRSDLEQVLAEVGLRQDDPRLVQSLIALEAYQQSLNEAPESRAEAGIPQDEFCNAIRSNILLIERALQGNLVIHDFPDFCAEVQKIYLATRENRAGHPATSGLLTSYTGANTLAKCYEQTRD